VEVRETPGGEPDRLLVAPDSLSSSGDGSLTIRAALVDGLGRPVEGQSVVLEGLSSRLTAKSDEFGLLEFPLGRIHMGDGVIPLNLECAGGRVGRMVYLVSGKGGTVLLPIDLDAALLPDKPFSSQAELQIYPAAPLELRLDAKPKGRKWIVSAHLVPESAVKDRKTQVVFATSAGKITKTRKLSPASFETTLDPGQGGWHSIFISATESESHIGAVLKIVEGGPRP